MKKYFSEGKIYPDYEIIFNGTIFNVHIKLLSEYFAYFEPLEEQMFREKKSLVINHKNLCNYNPDAFYFESMLRFIYLNNDHNVEKFVSDKNIIDLIEFIRLFNYFGFKGNIETIVKKIKEKILSINSINIYDKICQATIHKCGGGYIQFNSTSWKSCHATSTINLNPSLNLYKKALVLFYDKKECINLEYLLELFDIFKAEEDEFKYKLVGISTLNLEDIIKLPKEYQKIAMMSYCLEEFK